MRVLQRLAALIQSGSVDDDSAIEFAHLNAKGSKASDVFGYLFNYAVPSVNSDFMATVVSHWCFAQEGALGLPNNEIVASSLNSPTKNRADFLSWLKTSGVTVLGYTHVLNSVFYSVTGQGAGGRYVVPFADSMGGFYYTISNANDKLIGVSFAQLYSDADGPQHYRQYTLLGTLQDETDTFKYSGPTPLRTFSPRQFVENNPLSPTYIPLDEQAALTYDELVFLPVTPTASLVPLDPAPIKK